MKENKVEAEGGELILRGSDGSYAIIPAIHKDKIMGMLEKGCHTCISNFVSRLPGAKNYAEDGTVITGEGDEKKESDTNGNIIKIIEKEGRMPIVVYDESKRGMKFTGGRFYIPYHATKELIDMEYTYDDIFMITMSERNTYEDYYVSMFNHSFKDLIKPAMEVSRVKHRDVELANEGVDETDKVLYEYIPYVDEQYKTTDVNKKKKLIEDNFEKYKDSFLSLDNPIFKANPEKTNMLLKARSKSESIRFNTEGTGEGEDANAFGIRSFALVENPHKEFSVTVTYNNRDYVGHPETYMNAISGYYDVNYDPDSDDVYYKISGFDVNDKYKRSLYEVKRSQFYVPDNDYRRQITTGVDSAFSKARARYDQEVNSNSYKYLPISKIKEINPELFVDNDSNKNE